MEYNAPSKPGIKQLDLHWKRLALSEVDPDRGTAGAVF
jgi:hypothetical protein